MATNPSTTLRTRRSLLAAGLAAAAAAAAASVARFSPASAADGDSVAVGSSNTGKQTTSFTATGSSALAGTSKSAKGMIGVSTSGQGVHGTSSSSAGVAGVSDTGNGVHGQSTSSRGVFGESTSGTGVQGSGAVGVKAASTSGYALETTSGRLKLTGVSGLATIPQGQTVLSVTPGVAVGSNTLVLLTPEADIGTKGIWYTKPGSGGFNIHISESRSNPTKVSYLVFDHA